MKAFIGVEGPNDISFLTEISKILCQGDADSVNLEQLEAEGKLIFIPLGGSCLALWADRLRNLNRPELHICDRDTPPDQPAKYSAHVESVNEREGCSAFSTTKREMENYVHPKAIEEAYSALGVALSLPTSFEAFDDVPQIVAQSVHEANSDVNWLELLEEKKKKKCSRAKKVINYDAIQRMNICRLQETDGEEEIRKWLCTLQDMIQAPV